jgi:nitroreductase
MKLIDVINIRRTVRDFSCDEISYDIIKKALEAGLKAPSYNHQKQWEFILVKNKDIRFQLTQTEKMQDEVDNQLKKQFETYDLLSREMYLDAIPKQRRMIMEAPELLVIVYKPKTQIKESERVYDLNCLASVWCCIENILLSLAEDDVFGVTFIPQNTTLVKNVLNIPHDMEVAAFIPFGRKAENIKILPQKEVSLKEKLHINQW